MTTYQPMNNAAPTVSKHGLTFNEAEERQHQYPFQLCPECMSEHTEVVKRLKSDDNRFPTGSHRRFRHGIFMHDCERVNYICKDCNCEFYQWYRTGEKKCVDVDVNIAWTIIGVILTALSLFMLITSLSIDDPSGWMIVVMILSALLFALFCIATLDALSEILDLE